MIGWFWLWFEYSISIDLNTIDTSLLVLFSANTNMHTCICRVSENECLLVTIAIKIDLSFIIPIEEDKLKIILSHCKWWLFCLHRSKELPTLQIISFGIWAHYFLVFFLHCCRFCMMIFIWGTCLKKISNLRSAERGKLFSVTSSPNSDFHRSSTSYRNCQDHWWPGQILE